VRLANVSETFPFRLGVLNAIVRILRVRVATQLPDVSILIILRQPIEKRRSSLCTRSADCQPSGKAAIHTRRIEYVMLSAGKNFALLLKIQLKIPKIKNL